MIAAANTSRLTLFTRLSCLVTVPRTSGPGGSPWPNMTPCRRDSGSRTRGSAPVGSCSFCGNPWLIDTALSPACTGSGMGSSLAWSGLGVLADGFSSGLFAPRRFRKHSQPAARVFKSSHEGSSAEPKQHSRTPTSPPCLPAGVT